MRIGSLFSGAGGLDLAVEEVFGGRTVWHCEIDPAASKVLAHRWPSVPNFGSVTDIDWSTVEPVDVLCGGFPCQDLSCAGKRAGLTDGTRSGLWAEYARAVDILRPRWVVIENVRGILSAAANRTVESDEATLGDGSGGPVIRALGAVLGDLADIGYDAQWVTVAASAVGAPHRRERVFIVAHPAGKPWRIDNGTQLRAGWGAQRPGPDAGTGTDADAHNAAADGERADTASQRGAGITRRGPNMCGGDGSVDLLPTPSAASGAGGQTSRSGDRGDELLLDGTSRWGKYAAAIERWEAVAGPAPSPAEPNKNGNPRLAAAFPEWMMGWPAGWVTEVPGISRNDQLRIIGNGVVPQQAAAALRWLLSIEVAA
ncbi:hypothetical protein PBI_TWEETY_72 [Mycobacterium phage Tweety]|uniref:Cytosine-specific methyltransferase n=1 Tax=Mycobacterium phage Tweety TaxID=439809 RepID=A5YK40_9CAUD|nr:DNA methyltransferase [Mycobacterium phage Tweety]ABQ86141.1 hypothetical protein PBI_TWEETY_72 [Mycobacterium phage Tweety]